MLSLYRISLLLLWVLLAGPCLAETPAPPGFVAGYLPPETARYQPIYDGMKDGKTLEGIADFLNTVFVLPRDVYPVMAEAGSVNAFYVPDKHAVIISYELIEHFITMFVGLDQENGAQYATGALMFVIFHELGHCLISELELPATGREEDAVDEFATLLLIDFGDEGHLAILSAAMWFAATGAENDARVPFWDEHALSIQRFYGVFTLLYGTDPERYGEAAQGLGIPETRLQLAQVEYRKKNQAWTKLLQPYIRQTP